MVYKKLTLVDWAVIGGTVGSGLVVFVGFINWLNHVDSRVVTVSTAQAAMREEITQDRTERNKRDDDLIHELQEFNTRLSRIEGVQKVVLSEVRNGH